MTIPRPPANDDGPAVLPPAAGPSVQQKATQSDGERLLAELPPRHAQLVAAVASGATVTAAADAASIDRSHAHAILTSPSAKATLTALAEERAERQADTIRRIHSVAVDKLLEAVESGDVRAILAVIQALGLALPSPVLITGEVEPVDHAASMAGLLERLPVELGLLVADVMVEAWAVDEGRYSSAEALDRIAQTVAMSRGSLVPPRKPPAEPAPATVESGPARPRLGKRKIAEVFGARFNRSRLTTGRNLLRGPGCLNPLQRLRGFPRADSWSRAPGRGSSKHRQYSHSVATQGLWHRH